MSDGMTFTVPSGQYFVSEVSQIILTASAFVTALAWRDTFKAYSEAYIKNNMDGFKWSKPTLQLIYAILTTFFVITTTYYIRRVSR